MTLYMHTTLAPKQSMPSRIAQSLLGLGLSLSCAMVWAQADGRAAADKPSAGGFIGLGVGSAPAYQGSDQRRTAGRPVGEYRWANGFYLGGRDGLAGFQMNATPQLRLGLALGMDGGRKESDASALAGMGDLEAKATLHASAKFALSEALALSSSLQMGAGSAGKGGLLNVGVGYTLPVGERTRLTLNMGATLANADYMQDYFGVSAAQALASGYSVYTPSSGLRDISAGLSLMHPINRDWMLIGSLTSTTLADSAKRSPLTRSESSQSAFVAVAYNF